MATKVNKSEFVRGLPATMSAQEVVEAAQAKGFVLSVGFVYNIRSAAKKKADPTSVRVGRPKAGAGVREVAFQKLVVTLGTDRAKALINEVETGLAAIVGG